MGRFVNIRGAIQLKLNGITEVSQLVESFENTEKVLKEERRKVLYTYWEKLPFKKGFRSKNFFQTIQSDIKSFIIKYIRDGIEDEFSIKNKLPRRHAFTVKELYEAFQEQYTEQKYSLSNFHFHIKNLMEEGYIQEITKILHGRHYVIYYGRTAITFDNQFDDDFSLMASQNFFDPLKDLIKEMHPKMEISKIINLVDENQNLLINFYTNIGVWMKEKYPELYASKVDLKAFMSFASHFTLTDKKFAGNLEKIAALIDLNQDNV